MGCGLGWVVAAYDCYERERRVNEAKKIQNSLSFVHVA